MRRFRTTALIVLAIPIVIFLVVQVLSPSSVEMVAASFLLILIEPPLLPVSILAAWLFFHNRLLAVGLVLLFAVVMTTIEGWTRMGGIAPALVMFCAMRVVVMAWVVAAVLLVASLFGLKPMPRSPPGQLPKH